MTRLRLSLRARLIAGTIALLTLVCIIIGALSLVLLNTFLLQRVDVALQAAAGRSSAPPGGDDDGGAGPGRGTDDSNFLLAPGQAVGTVGVRLDAGRAVFAGVLDSRGTFAPLAADQARQIADLPADGRARDLHLGDLGDYRVLVIDRGGDNATAVGLPLDGVRATVTRLALVEILVSLAGLAIAGLAGALLIRRTLRPLDRVAATATRVSQLQLDRGEVALAERVSDHDADPRTEVGQVGAALNRLLGHVGSALSARQASETRVRQFVADASHELRTPLASIRGYAELTRRRGGAVDPDTAHALKRVEAEAARMTTLVEDLLLLARLDSGRPLEHEQVDMSRLVIDVVSDARAAGRDHEWALDLPDEAVTVVGDPARLHQVLANLLVNARTHTPPGTRVTTRLAPAEDHVLLQVADTGPGVPVELLPHVFERFTRGDASRSRQAGSTGLGLAIVSAVVSAHGGQVEVSSSEDGTSIDVRLPR